MTAQPVTCPSCGASFPQGKPMQHHLRDKHAITGISAHLIANPNDKQARLTGAGRRTARKPIPPMYRPARPQREDDFDLIDDTDTF